MRFAGYRIERQLRKTKAPPDCRKLVRLARSRPIVEALHQTILQQRTEHLPKSNLGEALQYALGQWDKFTLCLHNGELELDNNLVENAIRPTKLGAKNYLFFGSAEAGVHNALLYTLIENCKVRGLDPERYLAEVIERLPAHPNPEQAAALTPARIAAEQSKSETADADVEAAA
jgi:transposase